MARFTPGTLAYAKDGRSYTVDLAEDGMVYCHAANGIETEFPESTLQTESEWAALNDSRREISYARLRQTRVYQTAPKLASAACEQLLGKAERLAPGLLDFTAFTAARQALSDLKDTGRGDGLSVVKCRQIFDDARVETRAHLLAELLGQRSDALVEAARLGDNVLKVMVAKGMASHAETFEDFQDRPRR